MASSADYYIPSSSEDYSSYVHTPDAPPPHSLNNKIMVSAIVLLFCVIFFLTSLHVVAKWLWRSHNRNSNAIRRYDLDQATSTARTGLSKAVISQLPTFTYMGPAISDRVTGENAGLLECAVCLSEFQENEKGRLLPSCKHSFHIECIDMWFYSHSTCPLCRARVMMPTITTSPLMPITANTLEQQEEGEEAAPQEAHIAIETAHDSSTNAIPNGSNLAPAAQIPTNLLTCRNSTQLLPSESSSSQSSEQPSPPSAKATRCMPHITIEIPTRQDITLTSPDCITLTSRRSKCTSPYSTSCSSRTPLKSPGLRESLRRMLNSQSSKGKRVVTSCSQEGSMESPKEIARKQV